MNQDPQPGSSGPASYEMDFESSSAKRKFDHEENVVQQQKKSRASNSPTHFLDNLELKSGGVKLVQHGTIYQLRVLMLFLWRAHERGYPFFRLTTELQEAQKFDDVFFQYLKDDKWMLRLVQTKHREGVQPNSDAQTISRRELFSDSSDGNFSIGKYFQSFLKIRQRYLTDSKYSVLSNSAIEDIILLTNSQLDDEVAYYYFEEIKLDKDPILMFKENHSRPHTLVLKIKHTKPYVFRQIFEEMSDFNVLVETIAKSFIENQVIRLDGVFQEYFYPLMKEVFELDQKEHIRFRSNRELSIEAELLIKEVLHIIERKTENNRRKPNKIDLASVKIKVTTAFRSKFIQIMLEPEIRELTTFIEQMIIIIEHQTNQMILITNESVPKKDLRVFRQNLKSLAGHVLIYDDNRKIRFSSSFLRGGQLPDQIQTFRYELCKTFSDEFKSFYKFEFKISLFGFITVEETFMTQKLPSPITANDIDEFIDKFKLIVNYPNRHEISSLLLEELKDKYKEIDCNAFISHYEKRLQAWMSNRLGTFYTREKARVMFQDIQNNLSMWSIDGVVKSYFSNITTEFYFKEYSDFTSFLKDHDNRLLVIEGDLNVSRIKIAQTFVLLQSRKEEDFEKFTTRFSYLFFTLNNLANVKLYDEIALVCKENDKLNLIGIECDEYSGTNSPQLNENVVKMLIKFKGKVLILGNHNDSLIKMLINNDHFRNVCSRKRSYGFTFVDLTEESQEKLLGLSLIKFQGRSTLMELNQLLDNESKDLIDSYVFTELMQNKILEIGHHIPISNEYEEVYYIERHLVAQAKMHEANEKYVEWAELVDDVKNELDLRETLWTEYDFAKINQRNKISIISDVAGMGKSTWLTKISRILQKHYPYLWIIRINLVDFSDIWFNEVNQRESKIFSFTSQTMNQAIEFFIKLLKGNRNFQLKTDFEKNLFDRKLTTGEVAILFDGFDEISPNYAEVVMDLIKALSKSKIKKLIITTRPIIRNTLDTLLGAQTFRLVELSEQEQTSFLMKFWKKKLDLSDSSQTRIQKYAAAVIKKLASSIKNQSIILFCGVPLQLKMLAEILLKSAHMDGWESCLDFIKSDHDSPKLPIDFSLMDFYEYFVNEKFSIYCKDKLQLNMKSYNQQVLAEDMKHNFVQEHQYLAILRLFEQEHQDLMFQTDEAQKALNALKKINDFREIRGLIVEARNQRPQFIHRTFAEYFAAQFLLHKMEGGSLLGKNFFFKYLFVAPQFEGIRKFLHEMFQNKITRSGLNFFQSFFLDSEYHVPEETLKQIFLLAVQESNNTIFYGCLGYFYEKITSSNDEAIKMDQKIKRIINTRDQNGLTLIHFAAKMGNSELVSFLLSQPADSAGSILRGETKSVPENILIDLEAKDNEGQTAMYLAALNGHVEVLKIFLKCLSEFKRKIIIDQRNNYGETLLHCAVQSKSLETVKILIKNSAKLSIKNNDDNTAAHLAAFQGNVCILELLINSISKKERKMVINQPNKYGYTILHGAVQNDNLKTVKFLLKNGAELSARNYDKKNTAAHLAALLGKIEVLKVLIDHTSLPNRTSKINQQEGGGRTLLHCAVQSQSLETVKYLIENGAYLNAKDDDGNNALFYALTCENFAILKFLIEKMKQNNDNVSINHQNKNGFTSLHRAAENENLEIVKFLLENGADQTIKDNNNNVAAHFAAFAGNKEIVEILLNHITPDNYEIIINQQNKDGWNLLHGAVKSRNVELVKFLLENGADQSAKNNDDNTATHLATLLGNEEVVETLNSYIRLGNRKISGNPANTYAGNNENLETIKFLLKNDADPNVKCNSGDTVAHFAAFKGHEEVVEFLVDHITLDKHRISINQPNHNGWTLLHCAAQSGNVDTVEFLLCNGANTALKNNEDNTAVHLFAYNQHTNIVEHLIKQMKREDCQSFINQPNKDGNTILHCVANCDSIETAELLLKNGADQKLKNNDQNTAAHIAALKGHMEIVEFLVDSMTAEDQNTIINQQNINGDTLLHHAARSGNIKAMQFCLERGSDFRITNNDEETVVHCAVTRGPEENIQFLIDFISLKTLQTCINVANKHGDTLLHLSSRNGYIKTVELLLKNGADIFAKNIDEDTPVYYAAAKGHKKILKLLLDRMSPGNRKYVINQSNKHENTLLHYASENGHIETVQFLVKNGADQTAKNINNNTAVHLAALNGHIEVVEFFIDLMSPENYDQANKDGDTLLHFVAQSGHLKTVKFLFEKSVHLFAKNANEDTPVHLAALKGHMEVVRFLTDQMSPEICIDSINQPNKNGDTLILLVAQSGCLDTLEFILNIGGDMHAKNLENNSPAHLAAAKGHSKIVEFLINRITGVKNRKIFINRANNNGDTLLHLVAQNDNLEVVGLLLDKGADQAKLNNDENTAAHLAALKGQLHIVELLVNRMSVKSRKVIINRRNKAGCTLMHYAA